MPTPTPIADDATAFQDVPGVVDDGVSPPVVSDDGEAAEVFVQVDATSEVDEVVDALRDRVAQTAGDGLEAAVTGPAGFTADLTAAFAGIDGLLLLVAFAAVFVILVIVYRSPLLPLIVLGTSLTALCASVLVVVALARADVLVLNGQTQGILFILVIGAATDYSLLYIARYREALHTHDRKWDATWAALRGSWEPILASGGTVIAGLLMLLASELTSNKILGPVSAIGIAFALLAALTLLPALMLWAGRAAFWPVRPKFGAHVEADDVVGRRGIWPRVARLIARRPRMTWVVSTLLLARHGARDDAAEGRRRAVERVRPRRVAGPRRPGAAQRALPGRLGHARGGHRERGAAAGRRGRAARHRRRRGGVRRVGGLAERLAARDRRRHPAARPARHPGGRPDRGRRTRAARRDPRGRERLRRGGGGRVDAPRGARGRVDDRRPRARGRHDGGRARHEGRVDPRPHPDHPARARRDPA